MARRYDHTPEELKELAIAAGVSMIEEEGFAKFSARGVAARIGYTVGTLYHVFGSLDNFIMHINARTLDNWHQSLSRSVSASKSDPVKSLAKGYLTFAKDNYNLFVTLFEHQVKDVPEWYAPKMGQLFELVEHELQQRVSDKTKARHLAKVLWASIHGITVLSLSGKLEVVGSDSAEKLMETVLKGLLA